MNPVNTFTHVVISVLLFNPETDSTVNEDQDEWEICLFQAAAVLYSMFHTYGRL
jgi:hypothetical protein